MCMLQTMLVLLHSNYHLSPWYVQLSSIRTGGSTKFPYNQFVDPHSFAVIGENGSFRESSFNELFNPTSTTPPFFQIFDQSFLSILGPTPSINEVASNETFAFAHEAPIYVPATDEVFFASNDGGALGNSDLEHNNVIGKISLKAVETALKANGADGAAVNVPVTEVSIIICVHQRTTM